jgi:hypothetical protein
MNIQLKSNFENFKQDFEKDTRLRVQDNMGLYIQYYNARVNDYHMQLTTNLLQDLISEIRMKR